MNAVNGYAYKCKCKPKNRSLYRRLDPNEETGAITVYCLSCRGTWVSKTKYAVTLGLHVPAKRGRLSDEDILEMLREGSLRVVPTTAEVFKGEKQLSIIERTHRKGPQKGTYRFVYVCRGNDRKKIALHRLVWMAEHDSLVPSGFDVDHIYGHEAGDAIWNLRLMDSSLNRGRGKPERMQEEVLF